MAPELAESGAGFLVVAGVFAALVVSRLLFDLYVGKRPVSTLSI